MPKISIVIPLYNAQKYISRFVIALKEQTLQDFEALFVDDASTDSSAKIVHEFAAEDTRFKLLRHDTNRGAGAARNLGIRTATGETLCFADPDDLLPKRSLEARYNAFKQHGAIVRACHAEKTEQGVVLNQESRPQGLTSPFAPQNVARTIGPNPFLCAHWTWLFPTKMLQRLKIFNEENMRTAEEIMFLVRMFYKIPKLIWIEDTVYYWIKRDQSISNTFYTTEHYFDYFRCTEAFYNESIHQKKIILADNFFNGYLACYLPHILMQALEGKSSESEVQKVIEKALQIAKTHSVLTRYSKDIKINPLQYAGFFRLWHVLADQNRSLIQRLIQGQQFLTSQYQTALRQAQAHKTTS
jgi:glycosyltransferase involved in cell wall biosynthesis